MHELKPCPFCGGPVDIVLNGLDESYTVYHRMHRRYCRLEEPFTIPMSSAVNTIDDAVRVWNRRAYDAHHE